MGEIIFRKDKIIKLCEGKDVLHLGFIQHSELYEKKIAEGDWLHEKIAKVAKRLVGVDFLEKEIKRIKEKYGYECFYADVTNSEQMKKIYSDSYDVIVCGELIEHIDAPGEMLENLKKMMHRSTILIITTPNPWSKTRIGLIKKGILENVWLNKEHVCWYSYETLKQLLLRKGFREVLYSYYIADNEMGFYGGGVKKNIKKILLDNTNYYKENLYDGLFFIAKL